MKEDLSLFCVILPFLLWSAGFARAESVAGKGPEPDANFATVSSDAGAAFRSSAGAPTVSSDAGAAFVSIAGAASVSVEAKATPRKFEIPAGWRLIASGSPEIFAVPEMSPVPDESGEIETNALPPEKEFGSIWSERSAAFLEKLDRTHFIDMSRWAKEPMASFTLSDGWWKAVPLTPLCRASEPGSWLFGCLSQNSKSILPSHSPIVIRRIVVFVWYNQEKNSIYRIAVTIRGWREE